MFHWVMGRWFWHSNLVGLPPSPVLGTEKSIFALPPQWIVLIWQPWVIVPRQVKQHAVRPNECGEGAPHNNMAIVWGVILEGVPKTGLKMSMWYLSGDRVIGCGKMVLLLRATIHPLSWIYSYQRDLSGALKYSPPKTMVTPTDTIINYNDFVSN